MPKVRTKGCEVSCTPHIISGRMNAVVDDGTAVESGPGSVGVIQPRQIHGLLKISQLLSLTLCNAEYSHFVGIANFSSLKPVLPSE